MHRRDRELFDLLTVLACVAVALAVLVSCAGVPVPPPVQPPSPPSPIEIKHEPVCVPPGLVTGCWHQPPGQPWAFIAPVSAPACATEADLVPSEAQGVSIYSAQVFDAMNRTPSSPIAAESRRRLAEALRPVLGSTVCVIVGQEALFLSREAGLFEEWHVANEGSGVWWTGAGAYKGLHRLRSAAPTGPAAPSATACGIPRPSTLAGWGLHPQPPSGYWDYTPLTGPDADYCAEVGLGVMPDGIGRRSVCAVRPDEHPERTACEALIIGGTGLPEVTCDAVLRQRRSGGQPSLLNPYLASCPSSAAHWITICGQLPGAACRSCPTDGAFDAARCVDWTR